ncbi:MAG TPA: multicopper oxidase domain-containing protein, partial [Myxococcota bacterium]|nr:multicopper oxidase domain-containing protein [Myxococcota bacterium]
MRRRSLACLTLWLFLCLHGGTAWARSAEPEGARLYRTYCTACHGLDGDGRGLNVPALSVQPRDHTDVREMATRSDQELRTAISQGGPGVGKSVLMPPWQGVLSDDQIGSLVRHLRTLSGTDSRGDGALVASANAVSVASAGDAPKRQVDPGRAAAAPRVTVAPPISRAAPVTAQADDALDVVAPPPPASLKKKYRRGQLREFEIRVEETEIEVAPGFNAKVWAFNGQVPGPLLRVREGDEVKIKFVNLSTMDHTIHWHGMHQQGTWQSDGVPNVTQEPVPPGGSFTYHFIATRTGTLWYHCHVNVAEHVAIRGMWGPFVVDPIEPTALEKQVTKDAILMFSGWSSKFADRYGVGGHPAELRDYFSINGKSFPLTQPLRVEEGDVVRLRIFGAGAEVGFHLHGHDVLVTHKDGLPLPEPYWADVVHVEQGERYDAIVRMDNPGLWVTHDHVDEHVTNAG